MGAMDARRLELYELLKPTLGEQPAQALVLELPAKPEELATKADLEALEARIEVRFAQVDARFDRLENVLTRRMITILGSWTLIAATLFAWAAAILH
jgi:hypothetical protein